MTTCYDQQISELHKEAPKKTTTRCAAVVESEEQPWVFTETQTRGGTHNDTPKRDKTHTDVTVPEA